ncbi:MAG: flagellar hook-basal body complex protein FliE [Candidatus Thermoplasmatota archaeon]|nr:flagellar hook-basal body complex protein FliE [Candidatus Thermoplasmatota archaeon]
MSNTILQEIMLIVTGMPGSGKDEFVQVAKQLGWMDVHMGNTVKDYAKKHGVPEDDSQIGKFASEERKLHGMDVWARRTSELIKDPDRTIVDGLRNIEELDFFRNKFSNVRVIAIYANQEERLRRIKKRSRPDDIKDEAGLVKRDTRELEWGIGRTISLSDFMLVNDRTLQEFRDNAAELLNSISRGYNSN